MPTVKEYKNKLNSLKNIEKITRTMKLVAASKLRQALVNQTNAKNYATELVALMSRLAASTEHASHPLLKAHPTVKNILILILTSDRGLAGGFNNNLNKKIFAWIRENRRRFDRIDLSFCGKRGYIFFRSRGNVKTFYEGVTVKPDFLQASKIGEELMALYESGQYDEVYLAYNRFINPLSQLPVIEKFLPIEAQSILSHANPLTSDYIFEPNQPELLRVLIPRYFFFRLYYSFLENSAGEHGARMTAMDKASQNASELRDRYTLLRNRARQASITKELIEIVSGAEALKG